MEIFIKPFESSLTFSVITTPTYNDRQIAVDLDAIPCLVTILQTVYE